MKTLANCSPREFLKQTNRIRKAAASWMEHTHLIEIWRTMPDISQTSTREERVAAVSAQATKNIGRILDSIMDEHPDETAELLGLVCFVEPEDLDNHSMTEFFSVVTELIDSPEVMNFFISLAQLGKMNTFGAAKA